MSSIHSSVKTGTPVPRNSKVLPRPKAQARPARPRAEPVQKDAVAMLRADHAAVARLFAACGRARSRPDKKALVAEISRSLSVHAQIEEEIFYPAVRASLKDASLLPEALIEHGGMKDLIAQLAVDEPDAAVFDARVKVLSEYVRHHVKEEQTRMFPQVRASALDLQALAGRLRAREAELKAARP